jgi:hypothetical protein
VFNKRRPNLLGLGAEAPAPVNDEKKRKKPGDYRMEQEQKVRWIAHTTLRFIVFIFLVFIQKC